jgi:hypothetical protein
MSTAFTVDATELVSPSTPRALVRLEKLKRENGSRRETSEQLQEELLKKLDSASKKREEYQSQIQERAGTEVKKAIDTSIRMQHSGEQEKEELRQRLDDALCLADQKKNEMIQERVVKAGLLVSRAKGIALLHRQEELEETDRQKRSIQEALARATEHHDRQVDDVRQRAQRHVEHAKEVHDQLKLQEIEEARQKLEILSESLLAAQESKHEILEGKASRAGSVYYHAKDVASCVKDMEQIEQRRLSRDLENDLREAQSVKKDLERRRKEKLMDQIRRVDELRARRSSMSPPEKSDIFIEKHA